ncbi:RNA polymerase sigma factor [Poseidonocella sp. HB161398]|uniref:RNA polymerase sigma factor n=1 Tax=Poseidonocella sp. HB161398 TaxID=2320855 RepID=UPI0011085014|nr:RNA polymerase sigma factor [Poseidonocella sp. HB161398]
MITLDPELVLAAREGNRAALEAVVRAAERPVYNLALRMLANRADAEDATQEILVKIVTRLGGLREPAAAGGWAMRVAARHLVRERRRGRVEALRLDFGAFAEDLAEGAAPGHESGLSEAEYALAVKEVRIGCTLAMLVCLSRDLRIAYILGDVFELTETEAAAVLEIAPATYRQRLKRARDRVSAFVAKGCGVASAGAPCRCDRRVVPALAKGRIARGRPVFGPEAGTAEDPARVEARVQALEESRRAAALMRATPDFATEVGALTLQVLDRLQGGEAPPGGSLH